MTVLEFINKAMYDDNGAIIWAVSENDELQIIADVRAWGAIQNLFKTELEAVKFQDELGQFITDAINEKILRESTMCGLLHSPDWNGKCFHCGEQVFERETEPILKTGFNGTVIPSQKQ